MPRPKASIDRLHAVLRPSGALLAAYLSMSRAFEVDAAAHSDHDTTTLDLLMRVRLAGGIRAVELCQEMQKSASHVSRLVERAEGAGLLERRPDPEDRRAQQIALTKKGRRVVDAYTPHVFALLDRIIYDTLSSAEIDRFTDMLERVASAARAAAE